MKTSGITVKFDGVQIDEWTDAQVSRDMKDTAGSFSFTLRDDTSSMATFDFATPAAMFKVKPGAKAEISVDGTLVLVGYVDSRSPDIDEEQASVTVEGRDKTGDLIDSAALVDGPAEFKNVKLEDAVSRICKPFGLQVTCDIDTGEPFLRYSLDLAETAFSAAEKGARSRHAHILSDGVGGVVITRTGKNRAPADLMLPGNALGASGKFDHKNRHSETIVRGQGEFAGKERKGEALDKTAEPIAPEAREGGNGSATEKERKGTAATGRSKDDEISRYRPIVHLARSKAATGAAQDEADWRMRTARGESEEFTYRVKGHSVNGQVWRINELTFVDDLFLEVSRDMLISNVTFAESEGNRQTTLKVTSPEAFDKGATGDRRTNAPNRQRKSTSNAGLDGTAERL